MALICDTGPILAALDRDDADHKACARLLSETTEDLVVPGLVLAELDYWCRKLRLEVAWLTFMEDVDRGAWRIDWSAADDMRRARALQVTYADLDLGVVDASVVALAERLRETKLATLDRSTQPRAGVHAAAGVSVLDAAEDEVLLVGEAVEVDDPLD